MDEFGLLGLLDPFAGMDEDDEEVRPLDRDPLVPDTSTATGTGTGGGGSSSDTFDGGFDEVFDRTTNDDAETLPGDDLPTTGDSESTGGGGGSPTSGTDIEDPIADEIPDPEDPATDRDPDLPPPYQPIAYDPVAAYESLRRARAMRMFDRRDWKDEFRNRGFGAGQLDPRAGAFIANQYRNADVGDYDLATVQEAFANMTAEDLAYMNPQALAQIQNTMKGLTATNPAQGGAPTPYMTTTDAYAAQSDFSGDGYSYDPLLKDMEEARRSALSRGFGYAMKNQTQQPWWYNMGGGS